MRVVLAEDNALLRDGLTRLLESNGCTVIESVAALEPLEVALERTDFDVAVLDVRLPPTFTDEGLRAAIAARERRSDLAVLVLSQHVERLYARELLASGAGAIGYLLKDRVSDVEEFIDALHRVAGGSTVIDPEVIAALTTPAPGSALERLTPREREVLGLMAQGAANSAIAKELVVTDKAVAKHINSIFAKLDIAVGSDDHRRVRAVLTYLGV